MSWFYVTRLIPRYFGSGRRGLVFHAGLEWVLRGGEDSFPDLHLIFAPEHFGQGALLGGLGRALMRPLARAGLEV